jgi:tetratricopeptide (TPR) repeat protein
MVKLAVKLMTLAVFSMALIAAPSAIPAFAAGGGGGDPPASATPPASNSKAAPGTQTTHKGKKKTNKQSAMDDPAFAQGYRAAYATIYDRNDYAIAIEQLKALGHDDHPNVANLIGYSYRKLGDYKLSQVWYERALKADPNHVLTWQYYGLWQIEQGNRDQAQYHLSRIAAICGTGCEEYRSLAAALEKPPGTGLVY